MRPLSLKYVALVAALLLAAIFTGCENDNDGPISASPDSFQYKGEGFFLSASLDSGKAIHLMSDTLYIQLGNIWTFSNCALQSIKLDAWTQDTVLFVEPHFNILADETDCPAPYFRPDTVLKRVLSKDDFADVSIIKIKNNQDSLLDSIVLRRGEFVTDTFSVYMDSSFAVSANWPLRTTDKKDDKAVPTILRVLDSLKPQEFYWRTMEARCTHRVDMCKSIVADTVYPTSWSESDTVLVPIHYACADSDSVYCINSKWENDSAALGTLQMRPDTIWYSSTYYVEKIPACASFNTFRVSNYGAGRTATFIRQMMKPDESEKFCGPSSKEEWMLYNLSNWQMVLDTGAVSVDSLIASWNSAGIAPDTLLVEE